MASQQPLQDGIWMVWPLPQRRCQSESSRQPDGAATTAPPASRSEVLFRIGSMDCVTEESEIRQALGGLEGLRGLRFLLDERVLAIDADADTLRSAVTAIRRLGFSPERISAAQLPKGAPPLAERRQ